VRGSVRIVFRHRSNIARLRAGTEHRFGKRASTNGDGAGNEPGDGGNGEDVAALIGDRGTAASADGVETNPFLDEPDDASDDEDEGDNPFLADAVAAREGGSGS